jgi:hypothetical protein
MQDAGQESKCLQLYQSRAVVATVQTDAENQTDIQG